TSDISVAKILSGRNVDRCECCAERFARRISAMTGFASTAVARPLAVLAALSLLLLIAATPRPVLAQGERGTAPHSAAPDAATADDEFTRQLNELKKTFSDLSKKFDDSAKTSTRSNKPKPPAKGF